MKVAKENVVLFDHLPEGGIDREQSHRAGSVYLAQRVQNLEQEHDARGLVVAILLCVCCWAALGFFLLS